MRISYVLLAWGASYVPIIVILLFFGVLQKEGVGMVFALVFFTGVFALLLCLAIIVFQLADLVHDDRGIAMLYALVFFFAPPLGAIAAFSLCTESRKILKRFKVKVGLLGADPESVGLG